MKNARTQFHVTNSHLEHLNYMIALNGTPEQRAKFHEARVQLLDTLGDLLNDPKIARAWEDDEVNKRIEDRNDEIARLKDQRDFFSKTPQGQTLDAQSKFNMNLVCGLALFAYVVVTALWIYANFHGHISF